ncbi:MAG: FG-GAP-like repeat-containing protein [Acidobacteriota bacterium]|nr:FG-GAP-like repeat-containing protein [Acidobacteriota bacterium]
MNEKSKNNDSSSSFLKTDEGKTKSNTIEMPSIALPKGGGAIKGIEEKFQVNSVTGTSSLGISIPLSPSRHGFVPAVGLSYNSGSGNGVFGVGWDLSVPRISRKTEKHLPEYKDEEESDTFILSGAEDLVPLLENDGGNWKPYKKQKTENGASFTVRRYRPRIEGLFAIIEKWKNNASGETHWRTVTRDNVHSYFGTTLTSRLSDPQDDAKVREWRLDRTHDDKGNIYVYEYKREDFAGIRNKLYEKNRSNKCAQTYLKKILYGNRQPYYLGDVLPSETDFLFKVIFDYGEHDSSESIPKDVDAEKNVWTSRKDAFSDYRAGFEVRTYRRCRRALVFHCFDAPELPHNPYLTKSLELFYDDNLDFVGSGAKINGFSFLVKARQNGHLWNAAADSYSTKFLPETEFTYQPHEWNTAVETVTEENAFGAPAGLYDKRYLWIDLYNEGVSGILTEQSGGWFYKSNLGDGNFSPAAPVAARPNFQGLAQGATSILELEGNGIKYLVADSKEPKGFFKLNEDGEWETFKNFEAFPNLDLTNPNLRAIDLNGDGSADLLFTEDNSFRWYESAGEKGFEISQTVAREIDEEKGPAVVFADLTQSIFLADMNGDGLTDIVRIRNGEICYWANLGYGRFGAKVAMENAPVFASPDEFNPRNLRLADVDGSGTIDVVYLGENDFRVWLNLNGNEWTSEPQIISAFPQINNLTDVAVLDFLGTGTACIVWSSALPQDRNQPLRYINLMNGKKPHLLVKYENNCGKEVSLEYKSSTKFYLEDKKAGRNWITKLPFPVHCISKVRTEDKIRETVFTSSYAYAHGYFDYAEKEFRGFARVEQLDTEDFNDFKLNAAKNVVEENLHQPPVRTVSWFHTGAFLRNKKILHQCESEYFQNAEFAEYDLPDPVIEDDLSGDELREAHRALKGLPLRTEIYAEDETPLSRKPYTASQTTVEIRRLQPSENEKGAVFLVVPSESISYGYERNAADPRISHSFVLETDELGNVEKSASVVYPRVRRPLAPAAVPDKVWEEQNKLHIAYGEAFYTDDAIDEAASIYRLRAACESRSYEISGVGQPANFFFEKKDLKIAIGAASEILFEEEFSGAAEKRLFAHGRVYFLKDDLSTALPLGKLSFLGIAHKTYQLAFTKNLVTKLYGAKVTDQMLADAKYVHSENDAHWWSQSGTRIFAANPKNNFYTPVGARDIFGNENFVEYDAFTLLAKSATDAIGNISTVENDYRTLSAKMLTDINLNRAAVETDELGMVVKSAVMGKSGAGEGDTLADPTARLEYDLLNWKNNGKPNSVHTFAREKHGAANPRWQESYAYSDGGGSVIMTKNQAKAGEALRWNAATKTVEKINANPRWIGNGRTIFNNKGNPIKQFEPYFSATHEYESEDALVETGITPLFFYDPVGRNIRTEFPNGTFTKTEFDGWHFKTFDANDTVRDSDWYIERGSPDPNGAPEPTDAQQRAAWLAAKHYDTPSVAYLNLQGSPFYAVTDFGDGKTTHVRAEKDLVGRFSRMFDQMDRPVAESYTNLLGAVAYGKTAEKGERWIFADAMGRLVKMWEGGLREFRTTFDKLHRPLSGFVKEGAGEFLFSHILYGDYFFTATAAQNLNLKGRAFRVYDQSGSVEIKQMDFKGNALEIERRLTKDYKARVADWKTLDGITTLAAVNNAADLLLEAETFSVTGETDALGRPIEVVVPGGTIYQPAFNEANFLDSLKVKLQGQGSFVTFLAAQDYDAKGQRKFAEYGNGTITEYFYDPKTYRLENLLTRLSVADANSKAVQNLNYTFDPTGNITQIRDDAQQTNFFKNSVVAPENKYEYDAIYQLKKATGREHAASGNNALPNHQDLDFLPQIPHVNDANAVRNYSEEYEYDDCGNISQMRHSAIGGNWTKRYRYEYEDDLTNSTNRLKATNADGDPSGVFSMKYFHDAQGNMTSMPHLSAPDSLVWNFLAQLKEVNLGGGGTAFYCYGSSGGRIRKVIERPSGLVKERIYLGAVEIYRERQGGNAPHLERQTVHISDNAGKIAQVDIKTIDANNSDTANPLNAKLIRYQYGNHLGSATLETDDAGNVISYEEYHPFGTSSYRVAKSGTDLSLKRYRFSGKERDDETGFYYFGARYYAAWLGRWTSSDPAGFVRGFNLFKYCSNNPIVFHDPNGMEDRTYQLGAEYNSDIHTNTPEARQRLATALTNRSVEDNGHTFIINRPSLEWRGDTTGWYFNARTSDITMVGVGSTINFEDGETIVGRRPTTPNANPSPANSNGTSPQPAEGGSRTGSPDGGGAGSKPETWYEKAFATVGGVLAGVFDVAKGIVNSAVHPIDTIVGIGKSIYKGYKEDGVLGAINAVNPVYHGLVAGYEAYQAYERGDYFNMGRQGLHAGVDVVATVGIAVGGAGLAAEGLGLEATEASTLAEGAEGGELSRGLSPNGQNYARSVTEGGTGRAFAGHGEFRYGSGTTTVPPGTSITFWTEEGMGIPDAMGKLIETGDYDAIIQNPAFAARMEGAVTHLPGAEIPNFTLKAPNGLNIMSNSLVVEDATTLSDLLNPGMGQMDWAACLKARF